MLLRSGMIGEIDSLNNKRRESLQVDVDNLPDDPEELKALIVRLSKAGLKACDQAYQFQLRLYRELQRRYGSHSERYPFDPRQSLLFDEATLPEPFASEDKPEKLESTNPKRRKKRNGRRPLPPELRREEVLLELAPEDRCCPGCNDTMEEFGREVSERLEYIPADLFVLAYTRPKYSCKRCQDGVLTAELPAGPIRRGLPGVGLLAFLIVAKYADHLPLNRQEGIFTRYGLEIPRSTQCDWVRECAHLLTPLYDHLCNEVRTGDTIHADETPLPVLDPKERGKRGGKPPDRKKKRRRGQRARKGYVWTYVGDDEHPYTVYDYTPTRSRAGPNRFLEGFQGYLHTDDYRGYDEVCRRPGVTQVSCWAHARRKFYDARVTDAARSQAALDLIGELYALERELHDAEPKVRKAERNQRARPILDRIKAWLDEHLRQVLPKSPIGGAIAYALKLWPQLCTYLEDGRTSLDNNAAERALKPIVIGRKNWLFAGSDDGGRRAAILSSLIQTCRRHDVEPLRYLRAVLDKLPTFRGDLAALTPPAWKAANPNAAS